MLPLRRTHGKGAPPAVASHRWYRVKATLLPWGFLSGAIVLFGVFLFFPLLFAFYMSFTDWGMIGAPHFVGLRNYRNLLTDPVFWIAVKNTAIYTAAVPIKVAIALVIAVALNQPLLGRAFYRASFFFPEVISMVVVGILWQWMFSPSYGLVNHVLRSVGLPPQDWLLRPNLALLVIIIASIWRGLGNNLLIFLAGLQAIPRSLYEAAAIDGAGPWQQFFRITVPLLRPTTLFVTIITFIGSFKVFDLAYTITGGGPGYSTVVMVQYIYEEAFTRFQMGYASAAAFVLFVILFAFTAIQMRIFGGEAGGR